MFPLLASSRLVVLGARISTVSRSDDTVPKVFVIVCFLLAELIVNCKQVCFFCFVIYEEFRSIGLSS